MAIDPRSFLVKPSSACPGGRANDAAASSNKRDFFSALGKVGDLEVLNDVGAGTLGEGLRTLNKVSNSVRTGQSIVPGRPGTDLFNSTLGKIAATALDSVDVGAQTVLDTVGLGGAVGSVANLNPGVANRAVGQAKSIFQKVKQGEFELSDIPEVFSDLQNLELLVRGIYTPPSSSEERALKLCGASPFAMDLIRFAPKQKFLFIVDVRFREEYKAWNDLAHDMAFVIKQSTRPNVSFDYEEINMYNFRTRVPKRTVYDPMTLTFYDDNQNNANLFYTAYLRAMSPIANVGGLAGSSGTAPVKPVQGYQQDSMDRVAQNGTTFGSDINDGTGTVYKGTASLGALHGNVENLLEEIRIYHIFNYGKLMNVYQFFHPKILKMSLDELNMAETGNGSEMSFEFAYDGMYIIPNYDLSDTRTFNVSDISSAGHNQSFWPLTPEFGTAYVPDGTDNAATAQNMTPI